jgi:hypothetical protein
MRLRPRFVREGFWQSDLQMCLTGEKQAANMVLGHVPHQRWKNSNNDELCSMMTPYNRQ